MPTRIIALAVSKSFNGRTVLGAVTCSLHAGERTGIIGENGSGKSTLPRLFAGCEQPDHGEIVADAEGGVGYPAQDEQLPAHSSVQQIIDRSRDARTSLDSVIDHNVRSFTHRTDSACPNSRRSPHPPCCIRCPDSRAWYC